MTRSQLIEIVQADTEHKMDNVVGFDFQMKLTQVMQEFCAEFRFWWRKKNLSFSTAASTSTYDLTAITTTPAGAGIFVEEITNVSRIESSTQVCPLDPVTDDVSIAGYVNDTTTDKPSVWMPDYSSLSNVQVLRLGKVPNGVYLMHVYFWAIPNPVPDTSDDTIYIVPPFLHHAIQTGLEREVWRLAYGTQDPKYITAAQSYAKKVSAAKIKRSIDSSHVNKFINQDGEAIRSTGSSRSND